MWVKSGSTAYQLKGEGGEEEDLRISSHDNFFFRLLCHLCLHKSLQDVLDFGLLVF